MFNDRKLPKDITIKNTSDEPISFRLYGVNIVQTLGVGEELVITGASSETTGFYLAQMDDIKGLSVEAYAPDDPEPHPQPQPGVTHTVMIGFYDYYTQHPIICEPTLDGIPGEQYAEVSNVWYNIEEGIHTVRVEYPGYNVFESDINVLEDMDIGCGLIPEGRIEGTYNVTLRFLDNNYNTLNCDTTLDGVVGDPIEDESDIMYRWYNIEPGEHTVSASCDGYITGEFSIEIEHRDYDNEFQLTPEQPEVPKYNLSIHIRDAELRPVNIDNFELESEEDGTKYSADAAYLDSDYYLIEYNIPEGNYVFRASANGYDQITEHIELNGDDVEDFILYEAPDIEPEETYRLSIDIQDAGEPISINSFSIEDADTGVSHGEYSHGIVDSAYRIVYDGLPAGNYIFRASATGYHNLETTIEVNDNTNVERTMTPIDEIYTVEILVHDENDSRFDDFETEGTIYIQNLNFGEKYELGVDSNVSISDGDVVTFTNVPAGEYNVKITYPGYVDLLDELSVNEDFISRNYDLSPVEEPEETWEVTFIDVSEDGSEELYGGDSVFGTQDIIDGEYATRPTTSGITPPQENYEFMGFYTDAQIAEEFDFENTPISSGTTIFAAWRYVEPEPEEFTVTFVDVNSSGDRVLPDGESTVPSQLVMEGNFATRPNQDPELNGYSFGGFYDNQDFMNPFSFDEIPIYSDTEIYVLWESNEEEPSDETEPIFCTVKVGFNAEDDGVDDYVLVDDAKLEVTSVVSGDVPDEVFIPTVDENNMYVFENVPEGSYQISGNKDGYARFDESRSSAGNIVDDVYTTEITLYTASTMSVIFTDSFGNSETVDTVRIVDENDNEMSTFSVETQGDGIDKPVEYVYTSNTPLVNGTYYLVATKLGYEDVREEIEMDGWMNLTINLIQEI